MVRSGNSGGPLVDPQGRVMGVVFGAAVDDQETGFVLTAQEVRGRGREGADDDPPGVHPELRVLTPVPRCTATTSAPTTSAPTTSARGTR